MWSTCSMRCFYRARIARWTPRWGRRVHRAACVLMRDRPPAVHLAHAPAVTPWMQEADFFYIPAYVVCLMNPATFIADGPSYYGPSEWQLAASLLGCGGVVGVLHGVGLVPGPCLPGALRRPALPSHMCPCSAHMDCPRLQLPGRDVHLAQCPVPILEPQGWQGPHNRE